MEEFLIASGLAMLLALLGWSQQFKGWQRETLELERDFSDKIKINFKKIRPLLRNSTTPVEKLQALIKISKDLPGDIEFDEDIILRFSNLDQRRSILENLYKTKYTLIVILTVSFFISGIINYFIKGGSKINLVWLSIPFEFIPILFCVIFSLVILFYNINLNKKETDYQEEFFQIMEEL